ncbi:MAG: NAD(+) diphosphatase [Nocardiaceae bacterium]|nr:NAD(+) diphosphatase [Nocardiaceae bacterium]
MSVNRFERAEHLRSDPTALREGWTSAKVLRFGVPDAAIVNQGSLQLEDAVVIGAAPPEDAVFLGLWNGEHTWAYRPAKTRMGDEALRMLRLLGAELESDARALLFTALALLNWHDASAFSSFDGSPMQRSRAGWTRVHASGREEFPRTDPAVICLVHDGADRALLARRTGISGPRYALLAGFVEAGESAEECVEREIREEVGIDVSDIKYFGSQPWPFPRSLMLGFTALGDPQQALEYRDGEIAEARWFTRDDIRRARELGDWTSAQTDVPLLLPGGLSIARKIIDHWL